MSSPIAPYSTHTSPAAEAITVRDTLGPNGAFGGNVNAAGYTLGTLGGLTVGYKTTKEVWIGIRTSGKAGSGSEGDPYDGSSLAKFNALMATHVAANNIILLHDGEFQYSGYTSTSPTGNLRRGMKIFGQGPGRTIIKQMNSSASANSIFTYGDITDSNRGDNWIEGISFDCGYFRIGNPAGFYSAVILGGPNSRIKNCEVYGAGSDATECFVLCVLSGDGYGDIPDNSIIEDCFVHDCGAQASFISISNLKARTVSSPREYAIGGIIRNNVCRGSYPTHATQGIGLGGFDGGLVYGNTVTDMNHAYFDDTLWNKNLQIYGNYLSAIGNGIVYNTPTQEQVNLHIHNNTIVSNSCIGLIGGAGIIKSPFIHDNRCVDINPGGGSGNFSIFLTGLDEGVVLNNVCDATLTAAESLSTNVYYRGNVEPDGTPHIADPPIDLAGPIVIVHEDDDLEPIVSAISNNLTLGTALTFDGPRMIGSTTNIDMYLESKGTGNWKFRNVGGGTSYAAVIDANGDYYRGAVKLLGARNTGWGAMTGTPVKTTIAAAAAGTASVGYVQAELQGALNRIAALEARMKAYDDALIAHGLIGA